MTILPNFYFAPVSYFYRCLKSENVNLEKWEHFPKQTYRNRCIIQGANGRLPLIIPIEHTGDRILKDIKISYASAWQKLHWKSIQSSYQSSPYFEYYEDELQTFFEKKETFLYDLNLSILDWINKKLKLGLSWEFTQEYIKHPDAEDLREYFNAKKQSDFNQEKYIQVFSDRFEFMNDLSIIDLICNIGPKSAEYLNNNN